MNEVLLYVLVALATLALILLFALLRRPSFNPTAFMLRLDAMEKNQERIERAVKDEVARNREETAGQARGLREEVGGSLKNVSDATVKSLSEISSLQQKHLENFAVQLAKTNEASQTSAKQLREEVSASLKNLSDATVNRLGEISALQQKQLENFATQLAKTNEASQSNAKQLREELAAGLKGFNDSVLQRMNEVANLQKNQLDTFATQLAKLVQTNEAKLEALKLAVETKLSQLQQDNAAKLEEMRRTVDEKLQGALEKRLGESFKLVSERLEQVHKGLGEMQTLAIGVGDLKKVLTNVKTRGTWGEVQLGNLLEQILTPEQFARNVTTKVGSSEFVEFAIKLPGRDEDADKVVWLPIDAKFPKEDYERVVEASERADATALEAAAWQLEARIKLEAKNFRDRYLDPPNTTDFGILFLPTEGLYAEALRRPGLVELLQREYRVNVAGPTTLAALLNSLQMGFRTLAIQKRSSEVWSVLGAVKSEFSRFGEVIDRVQKKLQEASNAIDKDVAVRARAIERKLRNVQELPATQASLLIETGSEPELSNNEGVEPAGS